MKVQVFRNNGSLKVLASFEADFRRYYTKERKRIMKKRFTAVLATLLTGVAIFAFCGPVSAQPKNSINLLAAGMPVPDLSASVFGIEYERLLTERMSIMGRLGKLDYKYDDGEYVEDGDGSILDIGVRFYPGGRGMRGFFLGGNIGFESTDWTYIDDQGRSYESAGEGTTDSFKIEFEIGSRIALGSDNITLVPAARIGSLIGQDTECRQTRPTQRNCSEESELGFYVLLGLSLGIAF
jgi:hypothetical protein